ncbi:MAG TPA: hypothetical protein VIU16_10890, partial [Gaiellaceae bacterium]
MRVETTSVPPAELRVDLVGFAVGDGAPPGALLGEPHASRLARLSEQGTLRRNVGEALLLDVDGDLAAHGIAAAGVGSLDSL